MIRMSFAFFDKSCKYLDLKILTDYLVRNNIPTYESLSDIAADKTRCLYFIGMEDSGLKHQFEFIRNLDGINQWLIILLDSGNSFEHLRNIALTNFRTNLGKTAKDISVICDTPENVTKRLNNDLLNLDIKKQDIVLLASAKDFTGRKTTAFALNQLYPDKAYTICGKHDFLEKSRYAKHIIIVGNETSDFLLPCPEDIQHRVTVFYNKADESPANAVHFKKTKREILTAMKLNGWDLPLTFDNFFIGSIHYDLFYREFVSGEKDINEFKMNINYYMWDKYGLPCPQKDYTTEKISDFLHNLYVTSKLIPTI